MFTTTVLYSLIYGHEPNYKVTAGTKRHYNPGTKGLLHSATMVESGQASVQGESYPLQFIGIFQAGTGGIAELDLSWDLNELVTERLLEQQCKEVIFLQELITYSRY